MWRGHDLEGKASEEGSQNIHRAATEWILRFGPFVKRQAAATKKSKGMKAHALEKQVWLRHGRHVCYPDDTISAEAAVLRKFISISRVDFMQLKRLLAQCRGAIECHENV